MNICYRKYVNNVKHNDYFDYDNEIDFMIILREIGYYYG